VSCPARAGVCVFGHLVGVGLLRYLRGGGGELAIDLGTANTVVYVRGEGVVLFEPSVIALDERSGAVVAVGKEAERMIGRTPASIRATRPLRTGVITDFDVTEQMLRHFLRRAMARRSARPRLVLCVPSGLTQVERDAVQEAAAAAGARAVYPIEEPLAAAVGAGLPVAEPAASMVVDVGGGTTEVAVIALGSMVVWRSLRSGGFEMDDAIVGHVKREHGLEIGEQQAEQVKLEVGSAAPFAEEKELDVGGRDLLTGQLRRARLSSEEVRQAIAGTVSRVLEAVAETLEETPPQLAADIAERGMTLAGGGALLRGLPEHLRANTGLPVNLVDEPLTCVAVGAGRCLEELDVLERSAKSADRTGGRAALR
jgi:rod shape-determining protein MreB and related proteins